MPTLDQLRADTPGCAHRIHLNNAGASMQPLPVLNAVRQHLEEEAQIGGYEAADAVAGPLAGFYPATARLIGARPGNIAFTTNATDSYARALSAIPWQPGDTILTTENDYVSNQIAFLALQKRFQVRLLRVAEHHDGGASVDDMEYLIRQHQPKLVAVTHVPTSSGLVQPVEAIGALCRNHGVWYLVDACQSVGQLALDVERIGCDFLTATFRKFLRGPRGAGFLFVSDRVLHAGLEMLLPDMRSGHWTGPDTYQMAQDARRFEYWEMAPALILGSKAAAEYALDIGLDWIETQVRRTADLARRRLEELPGVRVLDRSNDRCGIVTAHCPDWEPQPLVEYLWSKRINARISPIYVARIDFPKKGVEWVLRVSPHYYNTVEEIDQLIDALRAWKK